MREREGWKGRRGKVNFSSSLFQVSIYGVRLVSNTTDGKEEG